MEQEKKKSKLKIIIPIAIVILAVIGIVATVIIKNNTLTKEEQYAVDYLLCNSLIKPNTTEISKVWVYTEDDKWYFAYDITVTNAIFHPVEFIYANDKGITLKELEKLKIDELSYASYEKAPAKVKGKTLNAEKIQKAFKEQY